MKILLNLIFICAISVNPILSQDDCEEDKCFDDPNHWNDLGHAWLDEKIPIALNKGVSYNRKC